MIVCRARLFEQLGTSARVTLVSGSPGSGKTVLLRSWIGETGLAGEVAWVPVSRGERDPRGFWVSVLGALRRTTAGSALLRALTPTPDLDGWAIAERLLNDLAPLRDRLRLVIDDVHELAPETLRQLGLLVLRAPPELRLVLAARSDMRLGLHRLRLEGELAEIREPHLRFSLDEARELFTAADMKLPEPTLAALHERTEGWAAGLRLAALSLAGHPEPERYAAGFAGSERTVAEYLVAEVLDRQTEEVRRLLLRTSILERVNGELAELLTGDSNGERALLDMEQAGAFVMSLDPSRTWFRYHQMFAELLQLELRRAAPQELAGLHRTASAWYASHGYPVDAIRHAQVSGDWELASALLAEHWPGLYLDGQAATVHELVTCFPARTRIADTGLTAIAAADELTYGSLEEAEQLMAQAERGAVRTADDRRQYSRLLLGVVRLLLARQRGSIPAMAEEAQRLEAVAAAAHGVRPDLGDQLRALALISLGGTDHWTARFEDAERHLEQGRALAQRLGRPYLEFTGLAYQAASELRRSYARAADHGRRAVELAERHGWGGEPAAGVACTALAAVLVCQGHLAEAERLVQRAERTLRAEAGPAECMGIRYVRGALEITRGHNAEALAAFQAAEPLARRLSAPHYLVPRMRMLLLQSLVGLGETDRALRMLPEFGGQDSDRGEIRVAAAAIHLAQGNGPRALEALVPVLEGAVPLNWRTGLIQAWVLTAVIRASAGHPAEAGDAFERALDLAERDRILAPFIIYPTRDLLDRHAGRRGSHGSAHDSLIADIHDLLAGDTLSAPPAGSRPPLEPLSTSELRVLRFLPTNLTAPEIARGLSVSPNTVKTHMRNLYTKLGTHTRMSTVGRARDLGLLAPQPRAPASRAVMAR